MSPGDPTPSPSRSRRGTRRLSLLFFLVGLGLLGGAVYTIVRQRALVESAWSAARTASPVLIFSCLLLPVVNWISTTTAIWILTRRYGRVRYPEMLAVIGAAGLLNMLPARPGTIGRAAYHKRFNGIRLSDSVRVLVAATFCTGVSLCIVIGMAATASRWGGGALVVAMLGFPPFALAAAAAGLSRRPLAWRWPAAIACRYVDMLVWAVRYVLVFQLIGHPVGVVSGCAIAAVGQLAMFTPVQLGLREWAIGLATAALPGAAAEHGLVSATAPGLLADCVMRASELIVVLPIGLAASAWVWRRMRSSRAGDPKDPAPVAEENPGRPG